MLFSIPNLIKGRKEDISKTTQHIFTPSSITLDLHKAFRTITTTLGELRYRAPYNPYNFQNDHELSPAQREEVQLCDALAHLAVIQHEVVAITTNRSSTEFSLIAATNSSPEKDEIVLSNDFKSALKRILTLRVWYTENTRKDTEKNKAKITHPTIVQAKVPEEYPKEPDNIGSKVLYQYLDNLERNWKTPNLPSHLWILSKLLITEDPLRHRYLQRYAITICWPKMQCRLKKSKSYIDTLRNIQEISFNPSLLRDTHLDEIRNDRIFLKAVWMQISTNDSGVYRITTPILHLTQLYNNLDESPNDKVFELYTRDTCMEFHNLLIELLDCLQGSLDGLSASASQPEDHRKFQTHLKTAHFAGFVLLAMVKGRALQMHLQNIETLLMKNHHTGMNTSMPVPNVAKKDEKGEEGCPEELNEDLDEDLDAVSQEPDGMLKPVWKIYKEWLLLIIVYFDTVDVLYKYVTKQSFPYTAISVKILVPPTVDRSVLSLPTLLTDPNLCFPKSDSKAPGGPTNEEILNFFNQCSALFMKISSQIAGVEAAQRAWKNGNHSGTLNSLCKVNSMEAKALAEIAAKPNSSEAQVLDTKIESLLVELHSKREAARLPFKMFSSFPGALHCEASLACMLHPNTRLNVQGDESYDKIISEMPTSGHMIGVSKYSCPTCWFFLTTCLKLDNPNKIITRGFHSTITACTLPIWTPEPVMTEMIQAFGGYLREEFIQIMEKPQLSRGRSHSSGSHRSIDSSDGQNAINELYDYNDT